MNEIITPPHQQTAVIPRKPRNSNLELYRIIVMLMIVAHHYVVNSNLWPLLQEAPLSPSSTAMTIFGAWGKTGINCFLMITGYFMCKSDFSWHKLLKLYIQIAFYSIIIYGIFCITGHETLSPLKLVWTLWPLKGFHSGDFISCFLMFYLFIPFLNIFLRHIDRRQHLYLMVLLLLFYALLPTVPAIKIQFNYVSWFMAIYIIAAYIRFYGLFPKISHRMWGILSLVLVACGAASVFLLEAVYKLGYIHFYNPYFFVADSNKLLSLLIAVASFMYFKDLKIPHSRLINALGAATFGVLLIHANSAAMRQWLWNETVDCAGHLVPSAWLSVGYAAASVAVIFIVCAGIDWFRGRYVEPRLLSFFWERGTRLLGRFRLVGKKAE